MGGVEGLWDVGGSAVCVVSGLCDVWGERLCGLGIRLFRRNYRCFVFNK